MKTHRIRNSISLGAWLCLFAIGLLGCATSGVPADRPSIEGLGRIGSFTWRGRADYIPGGGLAGTVAALAGGIPASKRAEIRESGVYEKFALEFVQEFSSVSTASVRLLDKSKYIFAGKEDERRVDVAATAKAEGFDAILESTVWPTLTERAGLPYQPSIEVKQLKIDFKLQRLSDLKLLWQDSFTIESANQSWNELARRAAKAAVEKYSKTNK